MSLEHRRKGKKEWLVMWWEARKQAGAERAGFGSCGEEAWGFRRQWERTEGCKQSEAI